MHVHEKLTIHAFMFHHTIHCCAAPGVGMAIRDVTINDKPVKVDRLETAVDAPTVRLFL